MTSSASATFLTLNRLTLKQEYLKMKKLSDMVLLGDQGLYEVCKPIEKSELPLVTEWVADLDNVMNLNPFKKNQI